MAVSNLTEQINKQKQKIIDLTEQREKNIEEIDKSSLMAESLLHNLTFDASNSNISVSPQRNKRPNILTVGTPTNTASVTSSPQTKSRPLNIEISKEDSTSTLASPCALPRTRFSLVNDKNDTDNVDNGDNYDLGWSH